MEAILNQILSELKGLKAGQERLEQRLSNVEQRLDSVEHRLDSMELRLSAVEQKIDSIEQRLDNIEQRLTTVEQRLDGMERTLKATFEQTGRLTEYRTEANSKFDHIINKISVIEDITKENLYDITQLKLANKRQEATPISP